jgi:hypothetical protein
MTFKRHEILGKKLHTSMEECISVTEDEFAEYAESIAPGQTGQHDTRSGIVDATVRCAVLEHLGYGYIEDLPNRLNFGADRAVDYYYTDWFCPEEFGGNEVNPTWPHQALIFAGALMNALLLCGLTGRWGDVTKICSWFNDNIDLESVEDDAIDDADTQMRLSIASSLSSKPLPGVQRVLDKLKANRSSRDKRLILLCAVWEAALAKDQKAFDKTMNAKLSHFLKHDAEDVPNVNYWVSLDTSFMWLLAERNGLAFPALPEKLDAAIVRRQTIGMA